MFWNRFVELCNQKNKSPNGVCADLGFSVATATKWKQGAIPRDTTLKKIADYFGTTASYLKGDPETPDENKNDPPIISESEEKLLELFREVPDADQDMVVKMIESAISARRSAKATEEIASNISRTAASIRRPRTFGLYQGRTGASVPVRGMKAYRPKSRETESAEMIASRKKVSK